MTVLACALPAESGVPLSRWSSRELAQEALARGICDAISATTITRWLRADAIRPWQHRSWIFPRDARFTERASVILDLYQQLFDGQPLTANEYVVCADEKPSIQARCRIAATRPTRPGSATQVEHEYQRRGALCYLAGWDVQDAKIYDRCAARDGIEPFDELVNQIITSSHYTSAERVFLIVDNGSAHRGQRSIDRIQGTWPKIRLIHTPVHASWLNQTEIYFSVVQRKVVTPNDFRDLDDLQQRLLAFGRRYERVATPFKWKFTRNDLQALLTRSSTKNNAPLPLAAAA